MAGETDKKSIDEKYGILKLSRRQRETAREILGFFLCLFLFFTVPGGLIVKLLVSITVYVVLFFAQVLGNLASILAYFKWYHAAIKVADAGLAIDKYDPYCHMYKIDSLALSKQPEEARKAAITASELITEYSVIYYSHWCLVYNQGDYGTAMDLANKIVELFPDDWAGYLARATTSTCFNDKKHDQLMLADIEKVMSLNKRDQDSFYLRSRIYLNLGRIDDAIADAEIAYRKEPSSRFRANLANCFICKYDHTKALEMIEKMARGKNIPDEVVINRLIIFLRQDMFDAALRDIESLPHNHDPGLLFMKGETYRIKGELRKAAGIAEDLEKRFPMTMNGPCLKARILTVLKRYDDAIKVLNHCLAINENCSAILGTIAWVHIERKEFDKTIEYANKRLALNKYDYGAARDKTQAYIGLKNISEAQKWSDYADEIYCDDGFSWSCHGFLSLAKSDQEQALENFTRAIQSNKYETCNYPERAKLFEQMGKVEEARQDRETYEALRSKIEEEGKDLYQDVSLV